MTRDVADRDRQHYQKKFVVQNIQRDTKKLVGGLTM
jgi:hypothetical protein